MPDVGLKRANEMMQTMARQAGAFARELVLLTMGLLQVTLNITKFYSSQGPWRALEVGGKRIWWAWAFGLTSHDVYRLQHGALGLAEEEYMHVRARMCVCAHPGCVWVNGCTYVPVSLHTARLLGRWPLEYSLRMNRQPWSPRPLRRGQVSSPSEVSFLHPGWLVSDTLDLRTVFEAAPFLPFYSVLVQFLSPERH